jgi:hypothetical protein
MNAKTTLANDKVRRAAYEPPRALHLRSTQGGRGGNICDDVGSGAGGCSTGFNAASWCDADGSTATYACNGEGSGYVPEE